MERTTNGQLGGVRIAAKGRLLVAVPVMLALGWAGLTIYLGAAVPADQRHLGLVPFLLLGEGACAILGLTLYLSFWLPAGKDLITADGSGLQLHSRRHGDRTLAWSEVAELGWMPGVNSNSGLIGKLRPAGNPVVNDRPSGCATRPGDAGHRRSPSYSGSPKSMVWSGTAATRPSTSTADCRTRRGGARSSAAVDQVGLGCACRELPRTGGRCVRDSSPRCSPASRC